MQNYFIEIVLIALMASTIGMFWTLLLMKGMVFGGFGDKLRSRIQMQKHVLGCNFGWTKLLKGLQCPYCVSIWIVIAIHILYYYVLEPTTLTIGYSIFILFFEMGVTTLINKITSVFINQKLEL